MKRLFFFLSCAFALSILHYPETVQAHSPTYTFRAYLDKRFWQPFSKYEQSLEAASDPTIPATDKQQPKRNKHAFAGMSSVPGTETFHQLRRAYGSGDFNQARTYLETAMGSSLTEKEREEILLVDAKIALREGEKEPRSKVLLKEAQSKLQAFLKTSRIPAWQSEARGWLARTHYLLDDYASAAKIYLDELGREDSIHTRESLVGSLRNLFPYNGSSARLTDHLEEYFDTPAHALFVVNIVTNPVYSSQEERAAMAMVAHKTMDSLQKHRELFNTGPLSDQLALALMRTAIYRGDSHMALTYSRFIPEGSKVLENAEYNWMKAAALFLQREYQQAEAPLLKIVNSGESTVRERNAAIQGLIGVYQKTDRRADQLHAAFLYETVSAFIYDGYDQNPGGTAYIGFTYWPMGGWLFDLPYLLDVQLSDADLHNYLKQYAKSDASIKVELLHRKRSAIEMARYALAVRYARQEKYTEAADIYEKLQARPRAKRMRELAALHTATVNATSTQKERLEARYAYASYLEAHSTQLFFNDMLWNGYQTWAFLAPDWDQGLTREERNFFLRQERKIRDEQEERWRAYKILAAVAEEVGYNDLGRRSARKALVALEKIHTGRFGREDEIKAAQRKLRSWLRQKGK